jgi:hypothetical protein
LSSSGGMFEAFVVIEIRITNIGTRGPRMKLRTEEFRATA